MQRRNTRQRQVVLDAVRSRCDHPTADQIYQAVHQKDEHISRGTVYRNLAILAEDGELLEVETPKANRYDLTRSPHPHMMCTQCGQVVDVPISHQPQLDRRAAEATGFICTGHHTVFTGVCPECAGAL